MPRDFEVHWSRKVAKPVQRSRPSAPHRGNLSSNTLAKGEILNSNWVLPLKDLELSANDDFILLYIVVEIS